jgi:putative intracellular protease/amidase
MNKNNISRILFVVTNHGKLGDTGKETGYFLREVSYPYKTLTESGYEIDFVSPKGGAAPMDPISKDLDDEVNKNFVENKEIMTGLQNTLAPGAVDPANYIAIFYVGGHGTMWDLPDCEALAQIAIAIYERGGAIGAICHGPAGLVNMKLSEGSYLVDGKRVASFTDEEEHAVELENVVPFLLASKLQERGAVQTKADNFKPHVEVDGRLVTGQNPPSARGVGEVFSEVLKGLTISA